MSWGSRTVLAYLRRASETPPPTGLEESAAVHHLFVRQYAPPLFAVPSWFVSLEERETQQYTSHLYCSTPPICTVVCLPFVRQYFGESTGGWGHRKVLEYIVPELCEAERIDIPNSLRSELFFGWEHYIGASHEKFHAAP